MIGPLIIILEPEDSKCSNASLWLLRFSIQLIKIIIKNVKKWYYHIKYAHASVLTILLELELGKARSILLVVGPKEAVWFVEFSCPAVIKSLKEAIADPAWVQSTIATINGIVIGGKKNFAYPIKK